MQSPSSHQKEQQETTSRTTTTTATATTTSAITAIGSNNNHHNNNNSNRAGLSSSESSGTLLDSKRESTRNIISEQVTSKKNSNSNNDSNENENDNISSSSSNFQVGQQGDLSHIPHSSKVAETSLEHAFKHAPRTSVGVVVVEADKIAGNADRIEVADLDGASSSNSPPSNQDHNSVDSKAQLRLKRGSNELPLSLPCNSNTITNPNRHQLDQSVSLKKLDQRIKVTLSAPRTASLSDQQIEPVLFESTANIPASVSSSTLSSNLVANNNINNNNNNNSNNNSNNYNYNGSKRRQSTATLISASGCGTGTSSLTNVRVQVEPNQYQQAEYKEAIPTVNHHYNQKERLEENLHRIASQRLSRGKQTITSTVPQQVKVKQSSQESPKELKQISPINQQQQQQQQQQARNQLQADRNNQLSIDQNNTPKQLAIYINGKIRSNSIFRQSTSANSFSSLLNRFSGGSNNNYNSSTLETTNATTTNTQIFRQKQPSRHINQIDNGTGEIISGITSNHQADKKQQSFCQRLKQKSFKWNGKRLNKQVEQTISKDQQLKQGGRNKVFSFSYNAKRFFNNHLFADNADDVYESASLTNNQTITSDKDSKEFQKTPLCGTEYKKSNLNQTNKELATLAAETKVIIESETSESSGQQQTSNNQEQEQEEQEQQTTKPSYKLNPSSMFLRKAMRYYRLWIYCTNITILLGTLIFTLSTIYVMSDYRFRLLVSQSPIRQSTLLENEYDRATATTNHNLNDKQQQQQQQSIINQVDKSSLPDIKPPLETLLPSNSNQIPSSQFTSGGSESESGKDFDIHINYSEPSVILAYAVIAIQAGILQAIGCFGAIRMKERWIQAFWYLILGLTVFDVVFLLYWLNRYEFIVNSLQQHMKFRLKEHYGSFVVETEAELGEESKTIPNQLTSISGSIIENYFNFASNDPSIELLDRNNHDYYTSSTSGSKRSSRSTLFTGGGELSIVLKDELHSQMDKILTEIIDKIQTDSQCCGISNSLDYKRSKWRQIKLDQLRVRLNWTETDRGEEAAIKDGTTRDKRISDLNVAANLLRRVPLVPASCCKPVKRDKALKTNRRDNQPVILDDSQIERAPRVPAWSPSMVVENLQDSTTNVRRKANLAAVSAINQLATKGGKKEEIEGGDNRDNNEVNVAVDGGDEQEDEGGDENERGREDYDVYNSDISNSNTKRRKNYLEGEKRNKLWQNNELSLADMLDTRWSIHEINSERDHHNPTRDRNIILGVNSQLDNDDDDEDFYNNLNNQQRRLLSKQENFNYPARSILEERNEREGDNTDTNRRKRRWLVESRVDEREQVLSRYIEDLKEEFQRKKDSSVSEREEKGPSKTDLNKEDINNKGKLDALRGFLFRQVSCNLSKSSNSSEFLHDRLDKNDGSCHNYTSDENFKWPNKLQLSFNQYKVLESYLLLDDNLTNNSEMSNVGDENEPYDDNGMSSHNFHAENYKHRSKTVGDESAVEVASRVIGQNGTNRLSFGLSVEEIVRNRSDKVNDRAVNKKIRKRNVGAESNGDKYKITVEDQQQSKIDKSGSLSESKRLRLELAEAIRSDSDTTCAPRSYFDQATIYTHGCHPVIKSWLDSSAHILFVTGFCVLTVLKFCSVVLLRLEIQEMIHKIRVLKGMATEYNALHDLEAYLPRPSICAQAAELTPSGVTAAIATTPTTNQSGSCCIGGVISCNTGTINQQQPQQQSQQQQQQQQYQPPLVPPPRLGGSFSEAVVAAATAASQQQQQQQQQHYPFQHQHSTSISNQPSINLFGQLGFGLAGTLSGRATSMKAMTGMSNMLTPELCPRSSSASSAHLQATTFLASQKHALSLRSELFQPSSVMSRRHTAVSVCPAAAAAAAAAAHHLMSRRGTYVANPVFNAAPLINSGLNLNQHRHSAHTLGCASSLLKPPLRQQLSGPKPNQACHCLLSSHDSTQINEPNSTTCPSGVNHGHYNDHSQHQQQQQQAHFEHQSSVESNPTQQHLAGQVITNTATTSSNQTVPQTSKQNRGSQQLLSLVYPFKRQSSGGAQSACNFSLDLSPPMITESRRSIH